MKTLSVIIFDCDGVMFDSRRANINYYNHLLSLFDLPPMKDEDIPFVCMHTADESIRHIFRGTPHLARALEARMNIDYTPFIHDMVIEPGFKSLLRQLSPLFGLAVATNRSDTIDDVLKIHGLEDIFNIVVSSLDVEHPKPHPESILKILDFFSIGPLQSLYVGDSQVDSTTAKAAGVPFAAYKNRDIEAAYHINRFSEMNEIIENWNAVTHQSLEESGSPG
jgi:phosphoglycolate phosphatase-like HAD superfamily hydrolase